MPASSNLSFHPLTPERWVDLEQLFGEKGAYGGCWCMWWRSTRRQFESRGGEGNRKQLKALVDLGTIPGVLAYDHHRPIGWCSIAPREQYSSLERSPVLKRVDAEPVWSVVCFYIHPEYRKRSLMGALLEGAVAYAASQGARIIEGYPTIPRGRQLAPVSSFMGLPQVFLDHGFQLVSEPSKSRQIVRKSIT